MGSCAIVIMLVFFSSRRRHTICALVTEVQTCALPISGAAARARCGAKRVQRRGAVGNADMWMGDGRFTQDAGGAGGDRLVDELVPVGYLALHRDEKVALRHLARVEGNALYGEVRAGGASASRRPGVRGPQFAHAAAPRPTVTSNR